MRTKFDIVFYKFISRSIDWFGNHRDRDRMVVRLTTTFTISTYHHQSCEFESHSWRGTLDTILCDQICQSIAADRYFSPVTPVFSTNKTNHHDMTEILLCVALNSITLTLLIVLIEKIGNQLSVIKILYWFCAAIIHSLYPCIFLSVFY